MKLLVIAVIFTLKLLAIETNETLFLEPRNLTGSIYPKNSSNSSSLFRFRRSGHAENGKVHVLREYFGPGDILAARESVEYEKNALKSFSLDELQIGAQGRALFETTNQTRSIIHFEYQIDSKHLRTATEIQPEPVLIADTLPNFITEHWNTLTNGQAVYFRYAVIPRLETIGFALRQTAQRHTAQGPIAELEMRPSSWALKHFVDPLLFTVELAPPHHILQYIGRTTPKLHHGNSWDDFDALTVFQWGAGTLPAKP